MTPSSTAERTTLQATIDQLMANLEMAGGRLDMHKDLAAYRVLCESHGRWRDPAFLTYGREKLDGAFWLGFSNRRDQLVALAAVRLLETDDLRHTIEAGELWHAGGYAERSGLTEAGSIARFDAMPPSRTLAGRISYVQFQMLERGRDLPELGWMVSWLTQALAFREHNSEFAVSLVPSGPQNNDTAARARESFARAEFCLSGFLPPMQKATTLHLCHTSYDEYLAWGRQILMRTLPAGEAEPTEEPQLRAVG